MFNIMYACNCCELHQFNKPTEELFINGFVPHYPTSSWIQDYKKCKCSCRHLCREICREVNDEELESEEEETESIS